jgi:hypothetical protein
LTRLLTAYTEEIDDPAGALDELFGQIDLGRDLLAHSVGIVSCYWEFAETGVIATLAEKLPFDVIGCTAMGNGVNGRCGQEQLSLAILTSDTLTFSCVFSDPLSDDNVEKPLKDAYKTAREKLGGDPSLIFTLMPISTDISGDTMMSAIDAAAREAAGGKTIPIFGTLSNDTSLTYDHARVFLNGDTHQFKGVLLLIRGDINPRFFVTAISEKNIQRQKGEITAAEGCFLREVNHMPLLDYLRTLGITQDAITAIPIMVDYEDGTKPVAVSMYAVSSEGALCGGRTPVGASVAVAEVDYNSVQNTAEITLRQALGEKDINGIIAIPCYTRILVSTPKSEDEMEKTRELLGDIPFLLSYSGGEICPLENAQGESFNRFHNLT